MGHDVMGQSTEPRYSRRFVLKRLFDLAVLGLAHAFLLPVWLLLWTAIPALIWLNDRGPVFYRQERIGKDGKPFTIRKFRTMVPDADKTGPVWNVENDPRVTRIGRLLRRTALDELPQVLNIWKGEMSLVGPKPLAVAEFTYLCERIPGFSRRTGSVPGLTGLAQLYNREDEAERKLVLDLEYIERCSLWLDLKILVLSVLNTAMARWDNRQGKNAQHRPPDGDAPQVPEASLQSAETTENEPAPATARD